MNQRIAILASGEGTTAEAFIEATQEGVVPAGVALVICNKPEAGIFDRVTRLNQAHNLTVQTMLINSKTSPAAQGEVVVPGGQTQAEETAILAAMAEHSIDLILLMGYARRVGPRIVAAYGWRREYTSAYQAAMLNTHPGLLPATKGYYGIHVQELVLSQNLPSGGQTLHVVSEDYDEGPTIAEHVVPLEPDDTPETLFERVKAVERTWVPRDVASFILAKRKLLAAQKR